MPSTYNPRKKLENHQRELLKTNFFLKFFKIQNPLKVPNYSLFIRLKISSNPQKNLIHLPRKNEILEKKWGKQNCSQNFYKFLF